MLGYLYWDPSRYIFDYSLPLLHRPILWYGFFFALGFFLGYLILRYLLTSFFFSRPHFTQEDIVSPPVILNIAEQKKEDKTLHHRMHNPGKGALSEWLNGLMDNPKLSSLGASEKNPFKNYIERLPAHAKELLKRRFYLEVLFAPALLTISQKAKILSEKISFACILGAVLGARAGDIIFYQDFQHVKNDPFLVFKIWEGGLASHGGAVGVIIALYILSKRKDCKAAKLSVLQILDLIAIPTALVGAMIRIGNFMNQEILGIPTHVPWAVVFGHPADGSLPEPRHPVQLYESLCYLLLFFFLFHFWKKWFQLKKPGKLFGLFLSLLFSFRFFLEFLKTEQSEYLAQGSFLTMGQYLSLPFILLGVFLFFRKK